MVQKSIMSFFGGGGAAKKTESSESGSTSKNKKETEEGSPVKKGGRKSRIIDSDNEDETPTTGSPTKSDEEKENNDNNKQKTTKKTPNKDAKKSNDKDESKTEDKSDNKDDTSESKSERETPGFTSDTVPPLRETAERRPLKRKSESQEETENEVKKNKKDVKEKSKKETPKTKKSKKQRNSDSEEENDDKESEKEVKNKKEDKKGKSKETPKTKKSKKQRISSDSEEENEEETEDKKDSEEENDNKEVKNKKEKSKETPKTKKSKKQRISSDSDEENEDEKSSPANKKSKQNQEEIEDKKDSPKKNNRRKARIIDSDDEDIKTNDEEMKDVEEPEEKKEKDEEMESEDKKDVKVEEEEEEEAMDVDEETEKAEDKQESPARKKPATMHSFFSPRPSVKQEPKTPKTPKEEVNTPKQKKTPGSKTPKQEPKTPKTPKEEVKTPKSSKKTPKDEKKTPKSSSSPKSKEVKTEKKEKDSPSKDDVEDSPKKDNEDSPKKDSKDSPKKEVKKEEKKTPINPFAPKPKGSSISDDPGAKYNPGKSNYHPIDDAFWSQGDKTPYLGLAKTMEIIEGTKGRLRTIEILANFLRSVIALSPDDLLHCVYLCLNKVAPAFEAIELGLGETLLMKAIAQTSGRNVDKIKKDAQETGDLGIVAEQSRSGQKLMFQPAKLTIRKVFDTLKEICLMTGNSVQSKKVDKIKGMFVACRFSEARFIIRSLGGKLRIGLAEQSVLQAIAQAVYLTPPGQEYPPEILNAGKGMGAERLKEEIGKFDLILKTTYCEFPNYDAIIPVMIEKGLKELPKHCKLTPGIPLKPMLAHPTTGVSEVLKRFEDAKFTCEYKYDGERAQIHLKEDGSINIYSRNSEDNTTKYPDIIRRLKNSLGEDVKTCVIDTEAVAWDREKKQILPFQVLTTRKRKDAVESEIKVQVCLFPFDLLYLNGEALVREPLVKRRQLLRDNFKEVEGEFMFATSMDSTDTEEIQEFLEQSIKGNCEGLMVKSLDIDATYEIAKRSHNWLKLKKDYLDGCGDTLDVVVLGGFLGRGRRAGQYGGFLLGCYDPDNEEFQSICKIGTGFTDEDLAQHSKFLKDHVIEKPKSYYSYDKSVEPDQWFDAVQVWEIKCADITISPVHKAGAGIVDPEKGISLRFPRFLRIRDDKKPEEATSAQQVADMYNNQDQIKNKKDDKPTNDEDFY